MATATLLYGPNSITREDLVGKSVLDARCAYRGAFNIPDSATAQVNGRDAGNDTVLRSGDELTFSKPTGQKGSTVIFTVKVA